MMPDLLLGTDGDLAPLAANGDVQQTDDTNGETTTQRIAIRLRFLRGEYAPDLNQGTPWLEVLGERREPEEIAAIAREVIASTPGIAFVDYCACTVDAESREASVEFRAVDDAGHVITSADYDLPFVMGAVQ